jgi:hypothetical protein
VVVKDIFRKYPSRYEQVLGNYLNKVADKLEGQA